MVLSKEIIKERLKHLREILGNLSEIRTIPEAEFVSTYRNYWLAERGLQLAAVFSPSLPSWVIGPLSISFGGHLSVVGGLSVRSRPTSTINALNKLPSQPFLSGFD